MTTAHEPAAPAPTKEDLDPNLSVAQPAPSRRSQIPASRARRRLKSLRLVGLASITVTFLAASSAPTPLYATYQREWHFSPLTTTVVFGAYAVAFLVALLCLGRLSDHVGRRPLILAGIAGQLLSLVLFVDAHSVAALLMARVVQGLATGTAIGAIGAGMIDIDPPRGSVANATAPGLGTSAGALLTAFAVQWLPAPTKLAYLVLGAVMVAQAVGVILLPETSPRAPGAWRSLAPRLAVPPQVRRPLLTAAPVLFAAWGLAGFYGSLGPSLTDRLVGSPSVVDAGLGLGILAGVASLSTYLLRTTPPSRVMLIGTAALAVGVAAVLLAIWARSPAGFFAATAVAGVGFGAGFQGGIRLVAPLAAPDQRAGVLSVLFTVSYLGMGLPAVAAGVAVVHGGDLVATSYQYGAAVIALAAVAAVNQLHARPRYSPLN